MNALPPSNTLKVVESTSRGRSRSCNVAVLGRDITINTAYLDEFCFAEPTALVYDLMSVIGAVRCADRSFLRNHVDRWQRNLTIQVPVYERQRWEAGNVLAALQDCLNFLTGDTWNFEFTSRKGRIPKSAQVSARLSADAETYFVPYSHGLDSYAQVRLLQSASNSGELNVVCVFTDHRPNMKTWKQFCRSRFGRELRDIAVPVKVSEPHRAEPSFRSRPFLYYILAAHGALQSGAHRVLIPENGQGSFGGSLLQLGSEAPHRSCHPAFTHRLRAFLRELTGVSIDFLHPALFATKGQVMGRLVEVEPEAEAWLGDHISCSHDQRHSNRNGRRVHCGVCGNCLLRRMSLMAANVPDCTEYKFSRLGAVSLEQSIAEDDALPRALRAFRDLAGNSVRSMQRFSDLSLDPTHSSLWAEAAMSANALSEKTVTVHNQLMTLIGQHAKEWHNFTATCGPQSWVVARAA